jgi:hypothetical protein
MERVTIDSIDEDFVEYFQEGWGVFQVLLSELLAIKDPVRFGS